MNKDSSKNNLLFCAREGFSAFAFFMPFALSMGICSAFGMWGFFACAVLLCIISRKPPEALPPCSYAAFLCMLCIGKLFSHEAMPTLMFLAGVIMLPLVFIMNRLKKPLTLPNGISGGLSLGIALLTTVLLTNDYFGIGANGVTAIDMLRSYRSFGFHANWRGVLFGTIVMVIMITFPRKFKRLKNYLPAPFVALAVTLVLNLFLNPDAAGTAVNEAGAFYGPHTVFVLPFFGMKPDEIPSLLLPAAALALLFSGCICIGDSREKAPLYGAYTGSLLGLSLIGGAPMLVPCEIKSKEERSGKVIFFSCLLFFITLILSNILFARLPVASAAVVLIVGAWQSVSWGKIKRAFTGGVLSIILFVISFFSVLLV
ncbi:MAG: hypothetical protein GX051_05720 [Clostridiales bacterium]|nr:hypothetical protein [Clostridiales bacterium]